MLYRASGLFCALGMRRSTLSLAGSLHLEPALTKENTARRSRGDAGETKLLTFNNMTGATGVDSKTVETHDFVTCMGLTLRSWDLKIVWSCSLEIL